MRVGPNPNDRIFDYQGKAGGVEAHDDVLMQKEISMNGKKAVVFERTSNNSVLQKLSNAAKGFKPVTPEKLQAFFESRGLSAQDAHSITSNITNATNRVSARAFESALTQNNLAARTDEF